MHFKSLRSFVVLVAGTCLLTIVAALVIYSVISSSRSQATVEARTGDLLEQAIDERLASLASAQVGQIQSQLQLPLNVASTLARANELMGEIGRDGAPLLEMSRNELMNLIRATLRENPELVYLYIGWESNAFDDDWLYAGQDLQGHEADGRFTPWMYRTENGGISVEPLDDLEDTTMTSAGVRVGEYYLCVRESGRVCIIDPVSYEEEGGGSSMVASFNTPIIVDDEFRGIVGADLEVSFIQGLLNEANAGLYDGAGSMTLIAPRGGLIGYTSKSEQLGEQVADILGDDVASQIAQLENGELHSRLDSTSGLIELYRSFEIGDTGVYWTLLLRLPQAVVMADLQALQSELRGHSNASIVGMLLVGLLLAAAGLIAIWFVGTSIARPLRQLADRMRDIASGDGDLTRRLPVKGRNETAELATQFNAFADTINDVLLDVRESSESVRVAASEIALGGQDLSSRTETAASNLQETSASMEQLTSTVEHTAASSRQANQLSESASEVATRGGQVVSQVVQTMDDIESSSRQITEIVTVMDGIAFQTNLLALNASVEAARAGEQGRGFAVVASEVRQLASRSAEAAQQIKQLIDTSSDKTRAGAELVRNAGTTMDEIVASVARVTDVLGEISAATSEQSQGIGQVNQAVVELDRMTQENSAMVEESTTAAGHLQEQSQRLAQIVGGFTLAAQRSAAGRESSRTLAVTSAQAMDHEESERVLANAEANPVRSSGMSGVARAEPSTGW
ncbi:MAG TPA: methyl-accepting chemotaxis protein [Halomonas sp.]|nr:methyl-accepting chemotaxis protein [Halomonas sp.]